MKSPWIHDCNIGHVHIAWMDQIDCPLCAALKSVERSKVDRVKRPVKQAKVKICPACDGRGYMMFADSFDSDNGKKCRRCKGTGKL